MKKITLAIIFITVLMFSSQTVQADMGPKAGVTVHVEGVDQDYAFELLYYIPPSRQHMTELNIENFIEMRDEDRPYLYYLDHYPDEFLYYSDDEHYYPFSVHIMYGPGWMRQTDDHTYHMGYNAPRELKFALLTDDGHLMVSEAVERTKFNATYTWDLSETNLSMDQTNAGEVISEDTVIFSFLDFLIRVILTIAIELGVLALFKYKKKSSFKFVGFVNLVTQTGLSLFVVIMFYNFGSLSALITLILGEFIVFTSEFIIYTLFLQEKSRLRAGIYALTANFASLTISFALLILFAMIGY
mgnify:CR=1 FL=1